MPGFQFPAHARGCTAQIGGSVRRPPTTLPLETIAASQGYESKANAEKGIEEIKKHAPSAKVEDHSAA